MFKSPLGNCKGAGSGVEVGAETENLRLFLLCSSLIPPPQPKATFQLLPTVVWVCSIPSKFVFSFGYYSAGVERWASNS